MHLGAPFISPRYLGAVGAPFGRTWLPSVHGCIGLSDAHWKVNSAMPTKSLIDKFPVLGAPYYPVGGIEPSGAPCDCWLPAYVATSRWLAGTPDGPMNYSLRRLKFLRAGCSTDRASDCSVGGTGPSGATQSSLVSSFLI
jgi:hypothetical protein